MSSSLRAKFEGAAPPSLNMEEWQNRQRERKKQERDNKTQSAEILRNYRSGELKEEDVKLSVIRQEDRKGKEAAQQCLRQGGSEAAAELEKIQKLKTQKEQERQGQMEAERYLRHLGKKEAKTPEKSVVRAGGIDSKKNLDVTVFASVADKAAKFSAEQTAVAPDLSTGEAVLEPGPSVSQGTIDTSTAPNVSAMATEFDKGAPVFPEPQEDHDSDLSEVDETMNAEENEEEAEAPHVMLYASQLGENFWQQSLSTVLRGSNHEEKTMSQLSSHWLLDPSLVPIMAHTGRGVDEMKDTTTPSDDIIISSPSKKQRRPKLGANKNPRFKAALSQLQTPSRDPLDVQMIRFATPGTDRNVNQPLQSSETRLSKPELVNGKENDILEPTSIIFESPKGKENEKAANCFDTKDTEKACVVSHTETEIQSSSNEQTSDSRRRFIFPPHCQIDPRLVELTSGQWNLQGFMEHVPAISHQPIALRSTRQKAVASAHNRFSLSLLSSPGSSDPLSLPIQLFRATATVEETVTPAVTEHKEKEPSGIDSSHTAETFVASDAKPKMPANNSDVQSPRGGDVSNSFDPAGTAVRDSDEETPLASSGHQGSSTDTVRSKETETSVQGRLPLVPSMDPRFVELVRDQSAAQREEPLLDLVVLKSAFTPGRARDSSTSLLQFKSTVESMSWSSDFGSDPLYVQLQDLKQKASSGDKEESSSQSPVAMPPVQPPGSIVSTDKDTTGDEQNIEDSEPAQNEDGGVPTEAVVSAESPDVHVSTHTDRSEERQCEDRGEQTIPQLESLGSSGSADDIPLAQREVVASGTEVKPTPVDTSDGTPDPNVSKIERSTEGAADASLIDGRPGGVQVPPSASIQKTSIAGLEEDGLRATKAPDDLPDFVDTNDYAESLPVVDQSAFAATAENDHLGVKVDIESPGIDGEVSEASKVVVVSGEAAGADEETKENFVFSSVSDQPMAENDGSAVVDVGAEPAALPRNTMSSPGDNLTNKWHGSSEGDKMNVSSDEIGADAHVDFPALRQIFGDGVGIPSGVGPTQTAHGEEPSEKSRVLGVLGKTAEQVTQGEIATKLDGSSEEPIALQMPQVAVPVDYSQFGNIGTQPAKKDKEASFSYAQAVIRGEASKKAIARPKKTPKRVSEAEAEPVVEETTEELIVMTLSDEERKLRQQRQIAKGEKEAPGVDLTDATGELPSDEVENEHVSDIQGLQPNPLVSNRIAGDELAGPDQNGWTRVHKGPRQQLAEDAADPGEKRQQKRNQTRKPRFVETTDSEPEDLDDENDNTPVATADRDETVVKRVQRSRKGQVRTRIASRGLPQKASRNGEKAGKIISEEEQWAAIASGDTAFEDKRGWRMYQPSRINPYTSLLFVMVLSILIKIFLGSFWPELGTTVGSTSTEGMTQE